MRVLAVWLAIIAVLLIAAFVSQWWEHRQERNAQDKRDRVKEQITRGFPTPLKNRALEEANRSYKRK